MPLPANSQGEAVATLVHHNPADRPPPRFAVLYVHGWSDYFYNLEMAEFFTALGSAFYAVDMHAVGRSLRPHQIAGYVPDLREYFPDLNAAADFIHSAHPGLPLVVIAHSQGALTASMWAKELETTQQANLSALILNGPWLDLPFTPLLRKAIRPIAEVWGGWHPTGHIPISSPGLYERTISEEFGGEWPINEQWRVDPHRPAHPAWARTILHAQDTLARGLNLRLPILALTSDRSLIRPWWSEEMRHTDIVTDVEQTWRMLPKLSSDYTLIKVRNAVHDVLLSAPSVRQEAYRQIAEWIESQPNLKAIPFTQQSAAKQ